MQKITYPRLYSYVMPYDYGFAPNPYHGWCTVAVCKPDIRRTAQVGDWVMGTGSVKNKLAGHLVYAMQISETLTFDQFWQDARFIAKRPKQVGSLRQMYGDNIYHRAADGSWIQEDSRHSLDDGLVNEGHLKTDTRINRVLAGTTFFYFGGAGPVIPSELEIVKQGRAHLCRFSRERVEAAVQWLRTLEPGVNGKPANW